MSVWRWLTVWLAVVLGVGLAGSAAAAPERASDEATAPSLWLSPLEIHFGSVAVGSTASRVVTVHNMGNATLQLSGGEVEAPFAVTMDGCAGGVPGGGSCEIVYSFRPRTKGDAAATSSGDSNAGPWRVALHARGAAPELQISPLSLDFGRGPVGGVFPAQVVTVTNIGGVPVGNFRADPVAPPFTGGLGGCGGTLQPGQSCAMTFDFAPEIAGVFRKEWAASSDAGPFVITMQGRTYSGISGTGQGVTPRAIDFGPVLVGNTVRQTVVFRNFDPAIPIVNWTYEWISDDPAIDFDFRETCGDVLAPLEECELSISYRPRAVTPDQAVLNILNSQGIIDVALWGQGAGPDIVVDAPAIDMGAPGVGRSAEQTLRFTNIGRANATLLGLQSATAFAVTDSDCGETLAPGAACTASVRFEPHGYGRYSGLVELLTDRAPVAVQVYGGIGLPQLAAQFSPASIKQGGQTTLSLTIGNPNIAQTLFDVGLEGQLPGGLEMAAPPRFSPQCGDPTVVERGVAGFAVTDATLKAGQTCAIEVDVIADLSGPFRFSATAASHAGPSNPASADLLVEHATDLTLRTYIPSVLNSPDN